MKKINFQKKQKKLFIRIRRNEVFLELERFQCQEICDAIFQCKGKIFLTGVGKSDT